LAKVNDSFEVFITAPNGCGSALELLSSLQAQLNKNNVVTILENRNNCTNNQLPAFTFDVRHSFYLSLEEATMRHDSFVNSNNEWLVYLEDHVLISSNFIKELERFVSNVDATGAATFYALNGTPKSLGSRSLFSWVWGMAESKQYPEKPEPVCSAFLVKRSSVLEQIRGDIANLRVGELETKLIPRIIGESKSDFMTFMEIVHFEYVGLRVGASAIYNNSRIMGHLERSLTPVWIWPFHMASRYLLRPWRIHKVAPKTFSEYACLCYLAFVGLFGVFVGRFIGIGEADINLANAHPKI
jgi:hypothetical protein